MNPDTLRGWVKQVDIDSGTRPGTTTDEAKRIKELGRENRELKRANEILSAASSFFARELDPDPPTIWSEQRGPSGHRTIRRVPLGRATHGVC